MPTTLSAMPPTALESDESHPAADVHELVHLLEGVIHDHDARSPKEDGGNDGNTAPQIGTEFPLQELPKQVIEKRQAAESERGQQGKDSDCLFPFIITRVFAL